MADDALEDLVRRLTALVVKIDERDTHMVAMLEELREFTREQRDFNREQVRINARLETLMTEVFRERHNGHED
jgi:hypothetical protein